MIKYILFAFGSIRKEGFIILKSGENKITFSIFSMCFFQWILNIIFLLYKMYTTLVMRYSWKEIFFFFEYTRAKLWKIPVCWKKPIVSLNTWAHNRRNRFDIAKKLYIDVDKWIDFKVARIIFEWFKEKTFLYIAAKKLFFLGRKFTIYFFVDN